MPDTCIININGRLTDLLINPKPMTTRLQRSIRLLLSGCYDEEPKLVAEVYILSSGSWRRVEVSLRAKVEVSCFTANSTATFVSGTLHWLGEFLELK